MQAIILAGGQGKRLQTVVSDLPKPMAPIGGEPFLSFLLSYLKTQGVNRVVLAVCHLHWKITEYFQDHFAGIDIQYAHETTPLGTGGAIVNAMQSASLTEPTFILNGDSFIQLNYREMYLQHLASKSMMTIALKKMADCARYGKVILQNNTIQAFSEKGEQGAGLINAGVYLIHPQLFQFYDFKKPFSFELDLMMKQINILKPQGFITDDYFIDIGIPSDYARAQEELPQRF